MISFKLDTWVPQALSDQAILQCAAGQHVSEPRQEDGWQISYKWDMYDMNNISEIDLNDFYETPDRMIERPFI